MRKEARIDDTLDPFGRKMTKPERMPLLTGMYNLIAGMEAIDREILEKSTLVQKPLSRAALSL